MKNYLFYFSILFCSHGFSQQIKYNKNYYLACHNCYDTQFASSLEDVFSYTTTIELDIWDNEIGSGGLGGLFGKKMELDWYVKHDPFRKGNLNCCGGTFRKCLESIKSWSDKNSNHNVVTVFIDKKENWSDPNEKRKPVDLDQLLLSVFSKESIFTPLNLLGDKGDLKEATLTNWPDLNSLKGKIIFVITDGTEITSRAPLNEYLESQTNNAVCFVAPQITSENEINQPNGISAKNSPNVIFYNLEYNQAAVSQRINLLGGLCRTYNSPETIDSYHHLVNEKINFIALKNYRILK